MKLSWARFSFDLSQKTHIMGILNVTKDSFADGGLYFDKTSAIERAVRMVEEGAHIIDVGGESTRPGSEPVDEEEELRRTIPVIEILAKKISVPISIDTYKSAVAKRAIEAGASMVNDISGMRFDLKMPEVVAHYRVPLIIMHIQGTPKDMQRAPFYKALINEITDYLSEGIRLAVKAGVSDDMIIVDPGIGFGKTYEHNLEIIKKLHELTRLKKPILIGVSRKAFIGKILGDLPVTHRLEGTAAAVAISIFNGANIVRVHDVKEMVWVARVADAIKKMSINDS